MTREELIDALASYYHIDPNGRAFDCGGTVLGDDGEYRWFTMNKVIDILEDYCEEDDYDDYDDADYEVGFNPYLGCYDDDC